MTNQFRTLFLILNEYKLILFGQRKRCESERRLDGKVVVITGANTGIGKETAYQLSLRGAKVYIACRDLSKAETAIEDIKTRNPSADIYALKLDLSSLKSVRQFAKDIVEREDTIDVLVNNAACVFTPEDWKTEEGFEMHFGTNHLGHFLLTLLLVPILKRSTYGRIVNVSSGAHSSGSIDFDNINLRNGAFTPMKAYAQSKLANILFAKELAKRLGKHSSIKTYSLNPGAVATDALRHFPLLNWMTASFLMNPEMGSQTTLYCVLEEELDNESESGFYYSNCEHQDLDPDLDDDSVAEKLWNLSCDLVSLEDELRLN